MVKRMLIDATHPEETRVVVVNGTRLEELDVETSTKKQIKGNIYLAKVVRVEPSLQAAFVDYGGNRHGFLAFSEIHPDYFQIPVADRQALLAAQKADVMHDTDGDGDGEADGEARGPAAEAEAAGETPEGTEEAPEGEGDAEAPAAGEGETEGGERPRSRRGKGRPVETVGGDDASEQELERRRARLLRNYKIQEVIKRRQILLVQVVKEERGNKGAALTTYLSLAGRYCVLMPNTARGGGVSRKIISATDRRRLKAIAGELDCPEGMAVIVRTAGSERSKTEIKRDYEYLLRAWDQVRELTLKSTAPALVYEEASLIKRSIRDLYARDIDEVLVEGDEGYRLAKDYMRMLTPSHAKKVQPYKDPTMPMFHRYQVDSQLDAMHSPVVQLKSGGYIVISQTEALVAIDVNSGRATRERHIEETAFKTNCEAADEVARQLRLRDLAGLIVIDFIDMEENRNNHAVERRLKEALKNDRARIQVGKISAFGLLELSRQRLRPSLQETSFTPCPHCAGTGLIRSVESSAVHVLRAIEEEGIRRRSAEVTVYVPSQIALYILNQKRDALAAIEERYQFRVFLLGDDELIAPAHRMERVKAESRPEEPRVAAPIAAAAIEVEEDEDEADEDEDEAAETQGGAEGEAGAESGAENGAESAETRRRRRRRRRRRKGGGDQPSQQDAAADDGAEGEDEAEAEAETEAEDGEPRETDGEGGETDENGERKRRRGRRGGRRRRRGREDGEAPAPLPTAPLDAVPSGDLISNRDAVADVFERAEAAAEAAAARAAAAPEDGEGQPAARPPRRRRAARAESDAPAAVAAEAEMVAEETAEPEAEAKPKRAGRRKAADDVAAEAKPRTRSRARKAAEPEAGAEPESEAGTEAKPRRGRRAKPEAEPEAAPEAAPEPDAAPVAVEPEAAPEPVPEPAAGSAAESAAEEAPPAPAHPARKGWWNKLLS
ncbi:ribonuclease E/G [Magnetospirillum sp. UT-4]|uniref:Rne/Rng family ribonuclease n=1 Tax=Magnetospirillum sp. UT-4 TaxID=2681467 RepID=UPI00137FB331|nr:ribonuclease E/G [Magnetospirillum sp. UT-4]CAA7622487.1 Ribonuclease E [Magnetospirillum sp. UT-4]